jgi:hypothetical protein
MNFKAPPSAPLRIPPIRLSRNPGLDIPEASEQPRNHTMRHGAQYCHYALVSVCAIAAIWVRSGQYQSIANTIVQ